MRSFLTICFVNILSFVSSAQNSWKQYNDSAITANQVFFEKCSTLKSTKQIGKHQRKIDLRAIRIINQMFNDSTYSVKKLRHACHNFKNSSVDSSGKSNVKVLSFSLHSEGNLRVFLTANIKNGILLAKSIQLETKSRILCNNDWFIPASIDFFYMKFFINEIKFPLRMLTYQSYVTITSD